MLLSVPPNPGEPEKPWDCVLGPQPDAFLHLVSGPGLLPCSERELYGVEIEAQTESFPYWASVFPVVGWRYPALPLLPCRALWKNFGREGVVILPEELSVPLALETILPLELSGCPCLCSCLLLVGDPCLGLRPLGNLLTAPLTGISWDNFRGARVIALPGSPAYARNHGVYLTDSQVVPLGQLCGQLNYLGWPPGPVLRETSHPGLSTMVWIWRSSPLNSPCAHLVFCQTPLALS